jgi:hypothetical protein
MGRRYLEHDARFTIYRRAPVTRQKTEAAEFSSQFPVTRQVIDHTTVTMVHAPGAMTIKVPPQARTVEVAYGFPPGAYGDSEPEKTDGATFVIEWNGDGRKVALLNVLVNPVDNPDQRQLLRFKADLPASADPEAHVVFRTLPGATMTRDWTCWSRPEFR